MRGTADLGYRVGQRSAACEEACCNRGDRQAGAKAEALLDTWQGYFHDSTSLEAPLAALSSGEQSVATNGARINQSGVLILSSRY